MKSKTKYSVIFPKGAERNRIGGFGRLVSVDSKPEKPRKSKTRENLLDEPEIEKLKKGAKDPTDRFLVWTLLYTGMRISELIHMRSNWLDWNRSLIIIPEMQTCLCNECKPKKGIWKPKNITSARSIPIVREVRSVLQDFFPTNANRSVMDAISNRVAAYDRIRSLGRKAKIKHNVFPHSLRGTFATILACKDFNSPEIMSLLGWKSLKTADHYIQLSASRVIKAVAEKW
jgi:integrase/recombinase XerD